jgi:hypothetical protein
MGKGRPVTRLGFYQSRFDVVQRDSNCCDKLRLLSKGLQNTG